MPDWKGHIRARLASLSLSPTREAEIVEELSQHLDERYEELRAQGTSDADALRLALEELRGHEALAQYMRPLRQAHVPAPITPGAPARFLPGDLWQDIRYAARMFAKQPAFAAATILTLALGVGASTAIFSVVYGVLLKPLPFHEPDRLVSVMHSAPTLNRPLVNHGPATYFTYRDNQRAFEDIGAWEGNNASITGRGDPERVDVLSVSDSTLPLLRVRPLFGRLFTKEDDSPGRPLRVILTYPYWQRRFAGAENAIGQTLSIDNTPAEIIGILPASFTFLREHPALLVPMQLDRATATGIEFDFQALARLKPGVTMAQAQDDLARMIPLLPDSFAKLKLKLQQLVRPLAADVIGNIADVLWILFAAVSVVLLIACGNVANLFLIRAEGRQMELAMRTALGASRGRLARVLLAESVLLSIAGGALGLILAEIIIGLLRQMAPVQLPRVDDIDINLMVLLFALAISVASGMVFGLMTVVKFGRPNPMVLKEGGRSSSDAPARHRTRNVLVVAQVALALMLMVVSGLMIRTFNALRDVKPGFTHPEQVQTFRIAIPPSVVADPRQAARMHESIAERLRQLPGVTSVGISSSITMDGEDNGNAIAIEDFPLPKGQLPKLRRFKAIGPGYFETMGNPMAAGRAITWTDIHQGRPVIVVSEALAREYWGEPARAIGKRVRGDELWREIVGVSGNERDDGLNQPATAIVYWPLVNESYQVISFAYAVRSARVGTPAFMREVQQAVWSIDRNLPLAGVQTVDEIVSQALAQTSFVMVMLAIAAGVALLLGVVGIYGVITYMAAQRTREIGIRMAVGAQFSDVRALFLRHGLWLTAIGITIGIAMSLVLTRVMSALLFGVKPTDPMTYAAVSAALAAVALFATHVPARRAARVDPIVALRADA
jgi:putative ABC transport system permease protein